MTISFQDASVATYQQLLQGVSSVLEKGAEFAQANSINPQEFVMARLADDMMPLHFQVVSVCHHSLGALHGMRDGRFSPPSFDLDKSYTQLQALVVETLEGVNSFENPEALADKSMVFALGEMEMPFTNENFLMSFSLPNFYFHVTTIYDVLRMKGVALSKRDYLGAMRTG